MPSNVRMRTPTAIALSRLVLMSDNFLRRVHVACVNDALNLFSRHRWPNGQAHHLSMNSLGQGQLQTAERLIRLLLVRRYGVMDQGVNACSLQVSLKGSTVLNSHHEQVKHMVLQCRQRAVAVNRQADHMIFDA